MQQDAHEFLNFLINRISEIILGNYYKFSAVNILKINVCLAERHQNSTTNYIKSKASGENGTIHTPPEPTWVHEIFQVYIFFASIMFSIITFLSSFSLYKC